MVLATPARPENIRSQRPINDIDGKSDVDITDLINTALLEPMQGYQRLDSLPPIDENSEVLKLDEYSVYSALLTLNPRKASGPDEVPNWLLKEYFDFLAKPICNILNNSFDEQALPASWKYANVTPLLKKKPVTVIAKHIRPISLTPALSKLAEDFVIRNYFAPAVLEIIDSNQFGAIPNSSTTQALTSMMHTFASATDRTGAAVRIVLQHLISLTTRFWLNKILSLRMPRGVARWVCDFLSNRFQRVKLSNDCFSEWGAVPSGVPQGTQLGPWLFLLMINDLNPPDAHSWKYVDDTTLVEVVERSGQNYMQKTVTDVEKWSNVNKLQLINADKCHEMIINFRRGRV